MKRALISGVSGQDGSYLAELLLEKGYEVWGTIRRHSVSETQTSRLNEANIFDKIIRRYADVTDGGSLIKVLQECMPDEIYHLAAQSHVRISFDNPIYTANVNALGTLNLLEAARLICPKAKIYNAASSEMFGNSIDEDGYQRETTPMHPVSPYGCSKLFAFNICKNYRNAYGMFISNGILFNHDSPRRGSNFVIAKIMKGASDIKNGKINKLELGNLKAKRDIGHAKDYVRAMWLMLQYSVPSDFVIATGVTWSVEEICDLGFRFFDLNWKDYVEINPIYFRSEELNLLKGDCSKARNYLGWNWERPLGIVLFDIYNNLKEKDNERS